jgi:NAD+ synthase (glutamine-hydrolysing)
LRLALCQINPTVGDLAGNAKLIREGIEAARRAGVELVLFPELALTGYPPEDLLLREHFLGDTGTQLEELASEVDGIVAIVGFPERIQGALRGPAPGSPGPVAAVVHNAAGVLSDGAVQSVYRKVHLPNYGVFDEQRYFKPGEQSGATIDVGGVKVGVTVCEDLWVAGAPASAEAAAGASLIVNISASPYHAGKGMERERLFGERARETGAHVAFCAMVGGQDELVFDGHSFVLNPSGETIARGAQFEEDLVICELSNRGAPRARVGQATSSTTQPDAPAGGAGPAAAHSSGSLPHARVGPTMSSTKQPDVSVREANPSTKQPDVSVHEADPSTKQSGAPLREPISSTEEEVYEALLLGLRDYVEKNGFGAVVLGLSGGIDSALVACLAVDALGAHRVNVAVMPSPFSSQATQNDARSLAETLGVGLHELPIEPAMDAYRETLRQDFEGLHEDLTEENLQARIRGNLLMALSNKFGWLVLTTGNKSEMSVGYTTLYGDLAGGFAVIRDVPKTLVYRLALWRNSQVAQERGHASGRAQAPIPSSILERAPSAELREDQTDQDSLPPYEVLDRILHGYIELDRGREQLIAEGLPARDVELATRLVDRAEYKRRQSPPGIKITERAFGRDRRMPITNAYLRGR